MNYQKLFNYMSEQHGVDLLDSDMQEICNIVNEMQPSDCDCEVKGAYEVWTVHICKKCNKEQL